MYFPPIEAEDINHNRAVFWDPKFHGTMFAACTAYVIHSVNRILHSESRPYHFHSFINTRAKRIDVGCTVAIAGLALGFLTVTVILWKTTQNPHRERQRP